MQKNYARFGPFFANKAVTGTASLQGAIAERQAGGPSVFSDFLSTESALLAKNPAFNLQTATTVNPAPPENQSTRPVASFFSNAPVQSTDFSNAPAQSTDSQSTSERRTGDISVSSETLQDIKDEQYAKEYGGGMSKAELQDFETLISRLEDSKMLQAGQTNRARQREKFAAGLGNMMRNF